MHPTSEADTVPHSSQYRDAWKFIAPMVLLFTVIWWRTGWLSDDAYISYRTVDNFIHGYGLRYNVFERVQTYTNPLWVFLNAIPYFVTREGFYTFVAVCVLSSAATLSLAMLALRRAAACVVLALILLSSRAFMDFSTSGMENPLTHLLIAAAAWCVWRRPAGARTVFWVSFITALATLNRLDAVLLLGPILLYVLWQARSVTAFAALCAGLLPVLLWLVFALFYYGFVFPNTAYAKLWVGNAQGVSINRGMEYLFATLQADPVTPLIVLAASVLAVVQRSPRSIAWMSGAVLYSAYAVYVGGDFMLGRFFSGPALMGAMILAEATGTRPWRIAVPAYAAAAIAVLMLVPHAILLDSVAHQAPAGAYYNDRGVWDMRLAFTHTSGIAYAAWGTPMPTHPYAVSGRELRAAGKPVTGLFGAAGMRAFFAGPLLRLVDMHAITDPLLARLPPMDNKEAAIGHLRRFVPPGYMKSVETGENVITDPAVKAMYDDLRTATQGPLWGTGRWNAILCLNLHAKDYGIDEANFRKYRPK